MAELDVRNGGYYLGEEGAGAGILWFLKHCTYVMEETGIRANVLRDASSEQLLVVLAIPLASPPFLECDLQLLVGNCLKSMGFQLWNTMSIEGILQI